ncbi:MAG: phosphatidate cytidylyltransferase [Chloroflexi bacterium]|nr:phosphatidate cytidylyltransferase [Chloroflexota bacterium]
MTHPNLKRRVASATVGLPLVVLAIWLGNPWLLGGVLVVSLLSVGEFLHMAGLRLRSPLCLMALLGAALLMVSAWQGGSYTLHLLTGAAMLSLVLSLVGSRANPGHWAVSLASLLYPALLLTYFLLLRDGDQGREWLLLAVLSTFAVDTAAFMVGSAWGRHKLVPSISPGKSWEGTMGGIITGPVAVFALARLLGLTLPALSVLTLGLVLATAAVLGDLAESGLKRSFQVKDASGIIPGHGGLLDRLDSLLFTVVVIYYYRIWFGE